MPKRETLDERASARGASWSALSGGGRLSSEERCVRAVLSASGDAGLSTSATAPIDADVDGEAEGSGAGAALIARKSAAASAASAHDDAVNVRRRSSAPRPTRTT